MRSIILSFLATLFFFSSLAAQGLYLPPGVTNSAVFYGGLGISSIDDRSYFTFNLRPEFAFGKVGLGLDIPLRFDIETESLREEDWDETYDYLRVIRYLSYGRKRDPLHFRIGELQAARLGHGLIMNYYNNNIALYDRRKAGLVLDMDAGLAGFEFITSNLGRSEIFGGRAYYRPLNDTVYPLLKNFAIGASYVTDRDPDQDALTNDRVSEFGLDVELPIVKNSLVEVLTYADYAKILNHGSGKAVGVETTIWGIGGIFNFRAQLERRFLNKNFIPSYFDAFYEIDRHRIVDNVAVPKVSLLDSSTATRGVFGLLYGSVLNTIEVVGTFQKLDGVSNSGIMHLQATVPETVPNISARATYDRTGIAGFGDAFKLDERSVARLGIGYKIGQFLALYFDYIWTFKFDETEGRFKVQKRIEPQIALVYPMNFGR